MLGNDASIRVAEKGGLASLRRLGVRPDSLADARSELHALRVEEHEGHRVLGEALGGELAVRGAADELDAGMARLDAVEEGLVVVVEPGEEEPRLGLVVPEPLGTRVERLFDGVGGVEVFAVPGGDDHECVVLERGWPGFVVGVIGSCA
jgi:hypothetical protein